TAVIGQGRMGTALSNAMRRAALPVSGPLGRNPDIRDASLLILCVPDAQIRAVAAESPRSVMLAHCSGATTLEPLLSHEAFSLHPLLTVTKTTSDFAGVGCAVHASSNRAMEGCVQLAESLGMRPFAVADEFRPLYHAAATAASNFLVTVATYAESLAGQGNVPRDM